MIPIEQEPGPTARIERVKQDEKFIILHQVIQVRDRFCLLMYCYMFFSGIKYYCDREWKKAIVVD